MRSKFWAIALSIILIVTVVFPAIAQFPLPNLLLPTSSGQVRSQQEVVTTWVSLDGRRLFQIAETRSNLAKRVDDIQQRLHSISQNYFQSNSTELQVQIRKENNLPVIYVNGEYLFTITGADAKLQAEEPFSLADKLRLSLEQDLRRAKLERQPEFLTRSGAIASGIFLSIVLISWGIRCWQWQITQRPKATPTSDPVTTQLSKQQHNNIQEVRRRLFQLAHSLIWGSGALLILSLFPYTRVIPSWILTVLRIPFTLGIVALATYVTVRLSYVLIDRFTSALAINTLLTPEDSLRLHLRVSTISGVTKSLATLSGVAIGTLIALTTVGVNIAPLLAGAGLLGVVISLASQNIIKDAINGFFIILEDQYALGDVINVGNVGGLVENLNLRITQLRDSEGRLITIPNSEIKIVANLSSRWSRADLSIPVAYHADIDHALELINNVGIQMDEDPKWIEQIIETPQVLGVENFGDRGVMIRVWIKTQPLKQWEVAREYRRRVKIAFDQAGIAIPLPQQAVWLNEIVPPSKADYDGKSPRSQDS
ncbi:mechanosensitive ion channel family protein [Synechocystis sp. PCC 7509]|uniref:mechanosensitive ion channel family protein n=1 Tax=Synechocystis sp. PCC 7509 TaxID=927677 RepID=UPI0002AC0A1D|nr:mechanosensitive ion channel family protein [Synechocystis sp. PCC 7509]